MQPDMAPSPAMAVTEQQRRTRALAMLRTLHGESERVRAGRRRIQWCSIDVIVKQPADSEVLAYAVDQGWIAIAPNGQACWSITPFVRTPEAAAEIDVLGREPNRSKGACTEHDSERSPSLERG